MASTPEQYIALQSRDCRVVAGAAGALVASDVHLPLEALERAHSCVIAPSRSASRIELAHNFLLLLPPEDRAAEAAHLIHEVDDLAIRIEAFHILIADHAVAEIASFVGSRDPEVREFALRALRRFHRADLIDAFIHGLGDDDAGARWAATDALIDLGAPVFEPLLSAIATYPPSRTFHNAARRVVRRIDVPAELEVSRAALVESLSHATSIYEAGALAFDLLQQVTGRPAQATEA